MSNPTARQTVEQLQQLGMLEEVTGRAWGRVYLARTVLNQLENTGEPA